jgi:hypothetical protein
MTRAGEPASTLTYSGAVCVPAASPSEMRFGATAIVKGAWDLASDRDPEVIHWLQQRGLPRHGPEAERAIWELGLFQFAILLHVVAALSPLPSALRNLLFDEALRQFESSVSVSVARLLQRQSESIADLLKARLHDYDATLVLSAVVDIDVSQQKRLGHTYFELAGLTPDENQEFYFRIYGLWQGLPACSLPILDGLYADLGPHSVHAHLYRLVEPTEPCVKAVEPLEESVNLADYDRAGKAWHVCVRVAGVAVCGAMVTVVAIELLHLVRPIASVRTIAALMGDVGVALAAVCVALSVRTHGQRVGSCLAQGPLRALSAFKRNRSPPGECDVNREARSTSRTYSPCLATESSCLWCRRRRR